MKKNTRLIRFSIPYIDRGEIEAVEKVLKSGWWTTGEIAKKFEDAFRKYVDCKYSVAVNSGTAALHLALKVLGINKADEVIVPTMTFAATAEVVIQCQAKLVLCDCDPENLNINTHDLERKITKKTKAIIPVHMAGLPCQMQEIQEIARAYNLYVIEDAAHGLGAKYKGRMIGTFGDLSSFSFYVTKPISCAEGGMLVTNNKRFAQLARCLSLHGLNNQAWARYSASGQPHYQIMQAGFKYNLPDILAAIGLYQLKKANEFLKARSNLANIYTEAFRNTDLLEMPFCPKGIQHAWHLYIIKLNLEKLRIDRNEFIIRLKKEGVLTSIHFKPLHLHPFYRKTFVLKEKDFPFASEVYKRIVSLPLYASMKVSDASFVISKVFKILNSAKK